MSVKSSIGWCSMTLNPIKGLCQGGCWYCYYSGKRGIARRFKQDPTLRLDLSVFGKLPKKPQRVFLCSTNDYWGDWIPDEWREAIRAKTQEYPQHTFQLLTQQPQNLIDHSPYPDNWWVGVTATGGEMAWTASAWLKTLKQKLKFISFEPLLAPIYSKDGKYDLTRAVIQYLDWVIIGRLTGFGKKHDPKIEWIEEIVKACDKAGVKVFLKDNLEPLWTLENRREPFFKFSRPSPGATAIGRLRQEIPE